MPEPIKLKSPKEWVSEVNAKSNVYDRVTAAITGIELSSKWMEKNSDANDRESQDKAFNSLCKMPAQILAKESGKLTEGQRLELIGRLYGLIENRLSEWDVILNAIVNASIGSRDKPVHEKTLGIMLKHFTSYGGGADTTSERVMAKRYLDFVFKEGHMGFFSNEDLLKAKEAFQADIEDQQEKRAKYVKEGNTYHAEQCEERIRTRQGYVNSIDAELKNRQKKPQKAAAGG